MSNFNRSGHFRTNANGTTFWVRSHSMHRDHWDARALRDLTPNSMAYRATDLLMRSNVGVGKQGCFVNPNARCPICGLPVFYYANAFGSRVFFDDLGPPWPKHPCTDNPRMRLASVGLAYGRIQARGRGVISDLVNAANETGFLEGKRLGIQTSDEWTLCLVEHLSRSGGVTVGRARILDAVDTKHVRFSFRSSQLLLEVGDLVSMRGNQFSFFSPQLMDKVQFSNGKEVQIGHLKAASSATSTARIVVEPKKIVPFDLNAFSLDGWNDADLRHFETPSYTFFEYIGRYRKPILSCIARGARTPEEFAAILGELHYRTGVGSQWTPKLVTYLVLFAMSWERPPELQGDLAEEEMHHFHSAKLPLDGLLKQAEPIVRLAVLKHGRSPTKIAQRLNQARVRTAAGALWSPRLTQFLMDLIFSPLPPRMQAFPAKPTAKQDPTLVSGARPTPASVDKAQSAPAPAPAPLSREQIAARLGSLGRVVLKREE